MKPDVKNKLFGLLHFLFALTLSFEVHAQILNKSLPFFSGKNTQNGFLAYEVNSIASDSLGMVWMATNLGLYRYDGIHFVDFTHLLANQKQTQSNYISAVFTDSRKNIWVSHENALVCINGINQYVRNFIHNPRKSESAPRGSAFRIREDQHGNIWTCNGTSELSCLNTRSGIFNHFKVKSELNASPLEVSIRDFWFSSDTTYWLATRAEMIRFNPKTGLTKAYTVLPGKGKRNPGLITRMCPDPSSPEIIWLGTWGKGLLKFNTSTGNTKQFLYEISLAENISNILFDIIPRSEHILWAGGNGLVEFDTRTENFRIYKHDPLRKSSLNVNEIRSLYRDPNGRFWLGTVDGFSLFAPEQRQITLHTLPFKTSIGQFIYYTNSEEIYFVNYFSDRKLYRLNRDLEITGSWPIPGADEHFSEPFGFCHDPDGRFWIATTHSGLWCFDPKSKQMHAITAKKGDLNILDLNSTVMRCDKNGILWIGTMSSGLLRCDTRNPVIETIPEIRNRVDGLTFSSDGSLWIQEGRFKLHRFDTKTHQIISYGSENRTNESQIRSISDVCQGPQGKMFISTLKNGILEIQNGQINKVSGLEHLQNIHSIYADSSANLWMLSSNRLIRYDRVSRKTQNFSTENGLSGNLGYSHFIPVSNSEVWFQTEDGIFAIQTDFIPTTKSNYQLILNSIKLFDTEIAGAGKISTKQGIQLNHTENYLTFEFQAIAFHQQEDLQYAYMLEGLDPNWVESGNRHFASYQALPPGNYRFRVKVSDGVNGWETEELILPVEIIPAWWQTWAFRIVLSILFIGLIGLLIRYYATRKLRKRLQRFEQLQEIEQIRNRIARDIHDEIGSGLSKIALLSGGLERKAKNDLELVKTSQRVRQLSREVIRSMGEIIWAVNPGNDEVSSLISYVRSYLNQFSEESNIRVHSELITENPEYLQSRLRPELKRNLLMILKESLNNILKHANASEVDVHLEFRNKHILLLIRDNGNGIKSTPDFRHGNGMKNMQKRATELNGNLDIQESDGLRILLEFPWNPQQS